MYMKNYDRVSMFDMDEHIARNIRVRRYYLNENAPVEGEGFHCRTVEYTVYPELSCKTNYIHARIAYHDFGAIATVICFSNGKRYGAEEAIGIKSNMKDFANMVDYILQMVESFK